MNNKLSAEEAALKILELQSHLDEYEQLIEAIKGGEVDAFALKTNNESAIFSIQTVDYAYRILVENFGEGALNLSEEALILYTNNHFPELLNLPYESVAGHSFLHFIHPQSKDTFDKLFKNGLTVNTKGEINLLVANKTIPVYVSLTPLFPAIAAVGLVITDLTEKKKQEEVLKMKNAELETKNSELEAFAYIASHDLQGPLRKIQIFISRLSEKEINNLSENGKESLNRVQDSVKRMQALIQDLLAYSNTNTAERKFENTDLNKIVDDVKDDLKEELNDKHATLEATELHTLNIIPFQFRQIMQNLIGNALKYFDSARPPHIIIKSEIDNGIAFNHIKLSPEKKYCHISVSDNGIGFEPEFNEKIFEVFYRLHTTQYKGTGIGLAIVKKIVENHGGVITANGKLDKGVTFDIYLPADQAVVPAT